MLGFYILEGHKPVAVDDVLVWGRWFEDGDRIVKQNTVGQYLVSTVFLGLDHNFNFNDLDNPRPVLFETMVFGKGEYDDYTMRYCTWDEAEEGHRQITSAIAEKLGESVLDVAKKDVPKYIMTPKRKIKLRED